MNARTARSPLLPQEPVPVTPQQERLTGGFLIPALAELEALFVGLRAETDRDLPSRLCDNGHPYPYGRCREITDDVAERLRMRLRGGTGGAERALRDFIRAGGVARVVWGALRDRYFQNALQVGALYVDVSNDTVTVTKPKVEILPLARSGFEAIRGPGHFGQIAAVYWGAEIYANHALPALAPILPIVSLVPGREPRLQSATDYMIDLMRRDGFLAAERWLAEAPPPPADVVAALVERARDALAVPVGEPGRVAAIAACREARRSGVARDAAWRNARVLDYVRLTAPAPSWGA